MRSSKDQERSIASDIGGRVTPASGAFWSMKGDVRSTRLLVEAKRTDKSSLSIKRDVWEKIRKEALIQGLLPVLAVEIQDRQLAVLDWEDFLALTAGDPGAGELS